MDDNGKYIRLFGTIFLSFVGFIVFLLLLMVGLRLLFGVLDSIPWFSLLFTLLIICVPAILFITVYLIYSKHTKSHPSKGVRIFSYTVFSIAICSWLFFWIADFVLFFKRYGNGIDAYHCYNLAFLAGNVGLIFFVGIVQALTASKEVDWMDRNRDQDKSA